MSKDVDWKLKQERGVLVVEAEGRAVEVEKKENKKSLEFKPSWDLVVAGAALTPPVCCTLEHSGFLFMSKDMEWKLRQERRVFGDEAEHEGRLEFQPSVGSGRCRGNLEPAVVLYTGTRWFSIHVEICRMEAETGA